MSSEEPLKIHENISVEDLSRFCNPGLTIIENLKFIERCEQGLEGARFVKMVYLDLETTTFWEIIFDLQPVTFFYMPRPGATLIPREKWKYGWFGEIPPKLTKVWDIQVTSYNREDGVIIERSGEHPQNWCLVHPKGTYYDFSECNFTDGVASTCWTDEETAKEALKNIPTES